MAYNPVARGGGGGLGAGPGTAANTTNAPGAGQGNNDQFSVQNMQPEDYLGKCCYSNK